MSTYDKANLNRLNPDNLVVRELAGSDANITDFLKPAKEIIEAKLQATVSEKLVALHIIFVSAAESLLPAWT